MPGDLFDSIAEELDVVDTKACDTGDRRVHYDVGAVILSADTAFDDRCVDFLAHVGMKGHQCQETEVRGLGGLVRRLSSRSCALFQSVPDLKEILCEQFFRKWLIVDLNPFPNEAEVRRGVEAYLLEKWTGL